MRRGEWSEVRRGEEDWVDSDVSMVMICNVKGSNEYLLVATVRIIATICRE